MIEEVVTYAELGWRVFPVARDCRSPIKVEGEYERGCHDATSDPEEARRRWTRHPGANVSLACGPVSGVLALDIDAKGAVDGFSALACLEADFEPLPPTVTSRTPSGGEHRLFRWPDGPRPANRVGIKRYDARGGRTVYHGLDVRGQGASICLPPSRKAFGSYAWVRSPFTQDLADVPAWLLALMRSEPPARPATQPIRIGGGSRPERYARAALERECEALSGMAPGSGRNQRLFIAAAKIGELVGCGLLHQTSAENALFRAASQCRLTAEDGQRAVMATIASGLSRGMLNPRGVAA